jgi:hypothetical protein
MKLSQQQIDFFNREGFLVAENALKDSDLNPLIQEYEAYIDRRARELLAAGKISQLYTNQPFEKRLACICRENSEIYGELDIMHFRGRALFDFLRNDHLMDVVESLVGPEITCNPIQHVRAKLPSGLSPTGGDTHVAAWHQDVAVMREEADPYFVLTVWLPLCEATPENGCLQIIPRVNGRGLLHRQASTLTPSEMPEGEVITLPMQKGNVLLMHKETPHRSTPNSTDTIRWSMDLRYQKTGTPTGRSFYPDFVTRSRANPDSVLVDHAEWGRLWLEALEQSKGEKAYRWH